MVFQRVWMDGGSGGDVITNITNVSNIFTDPDQWDPETEYAAEDIVGYDGTVFICLKTDTGTEPGTDETVWKEVAAEAQLTPKELIDEYSSGPVNLTTAELYRTARATAAVAFNLPASASVEVGNWYKIEKSASGTVTVTADGTDAITWFGDGGTPVEIIGDDTTSTHSSVILTFIGGGIWRAEINGNFTTYGT